jgi:hypothetical protein
MLAMALAGTGGAMAAPAAKAVDVLTDGTPVLSGSLPARARADSAVSGVLNSAALSAPAIALTLADGQTITASLQRIAQDDRRGTRSWIGTFEDSPGSLVVLSKAKGVVTGYGNYKDQTFELVPAAGGRHVLYVIDPARLPKGDRAEKTSVGGTSTLSSSTTADATASSTSASGAVVQDVLLVYTAAAANRWGAATLQSMIQSAAQAANQAYINSYANITVNVVGLQQVSMTESGSGMYATMDTLVNNTEVQNLRKKLAADMVVLVSEDSDYCGYAKLTRYYTNGVTTWWDANAIVYSSCLSIQTVAHEMGHLQGLDHNRENTAYSGWYPYSYGYRVCAADGFRDIMSYACSSTNVPIINVFSNPSVNYNGYATGISYELDPSHSAENARTLNDTATTVAGYMVSGTTSGSTVPASPSGLTATSVAYNSVTLTWTDNATNESGYKVERSPDGVTFTEIASLGAGATGYADGSVSARSNYYYRVRAYNSAGASGYSNTVTVTTPDVPPQPPAAPSGVSASNDGDGTALVGWTPGSSSATSYDVMREKWNSRKSTWTNSTIAATVPASVTSIVDSTGSGTYRYYVRASNAGGSSAYAGPATVTVTSVSKGSPRRKK